MNNPQFKNILFFFPIESEKFHACLNQVIVNRNKFERSHISKVLHLSLENCCKSTNSQFASSEKRLKISQIHIRKILTSSRSKSTISFSTWKHSIFIIKKETKFQPCFQKPGQSSRPICTLGFPPLHKL